MDNRRWRNDESGAVAVIVAVSLVMLIGFSALVLDAGALYERRRQAQTAADGAALAAAQELPDTGAATTVARTYLTNNGMADASAAEVTFPSATSVRVAAAPQEVAFSMAPVLGFGSSTVSAYAVAVKEYREQYTPWALVLSTLTASQLSGNSLVTLDATAGGSTTGNFQAINVPRSDVNGANATFERNIEMGCAGPITVGQTYSTLTGNRVGPVTSGLLDSSPSGLLCQGSCADTALYSAPGNNTVQIDACTLACVFGTTSGSSITNILEPGCPRVVRVPVIAAWPPGSSTNVQVLSIAWFFIATPPPPSSGSVATLSGYILSGLPTTAWPYNIHLIE